MLLEMKASAGVAACAAEIVPAGSTDSVSGTMLRSGNDKRANSDALPTIIRSFRDMVLRIFCVGSISRPMDARRSRVRVDLRQNTVQLVGIGDCEVGT